MKKVLPILVLAAASIVSMSGCQKEPTYTITWKNDNGEILEVDQNVAKGSMPSYDGENLVKAGDEEFSYVWKGWSPKITAVDRDKTYTAVFEQITNEYTITFLNDDDSVLQEGKVKYGEMPKYKSAIPTKASEKEGYKYVFEGWDKEIVPVTGPASYKAVFELKEAKEDWSEEEYDLMTGSEGFLPFAIPFYQAELSLSWNDGGALVAKSGREVTRTEYRSYLSLLVNEDNLFKEDSYLAEEDFYDAFGTVEEGGEDFADMVQFRRNTGANGLGYFDELLMVGLTRDNHLVVYATVSALNYDDLSGGTSFWINQYVSGQGYAGYIGDLIFSDLLGIANDYTTELEILNFPTDDLFTVNFDNPDGGWNLTDYSYIFPWTAGNLYSDKLGDFYGFEYQYCGLEAGAMAALAAQYGADGSGWELVKFEEEYEYFTGLTSNCWIYRRKTAEISETEDYYQYVTIVDNVYGVFADESVSWADFTIYGRIVEKDSAEPIVL